MKDKLCGYVLALQLKFQYNDFEETSNTLKTANSAFSFEPVNDNETSGKQ